ncbi:MAG: hypothetical protein OEZ34_07285, partial [Spirochaetia bacterium]|nr:hypothetical protein [Spirochaetia bacterium]
MKNSSSLIFFIISFLFTLFILFTFPEFEIHHTNFTELVSLFFYAVTVSAAAGLVNFYFSSRYAQSRTDRFKKLIQKYFPQETAQERKSKNSMYSSAFFIKNTELWMQNISKKVQLLSLDRELFLSLLNGLEEGIFCVEKSGRILFQNKMIDPDLMVSDATGKPFFQAIRNSSILEHVHKMLAQINEKNLSSSEDHNLEIQTSGKFYKMICHPISSDSETEMILYLILDETESRLSEKTKEDFFMNAGHELKTPITSIQGYAETISDKCTNPDLKRFIEPILRNIYRMNRLVQEI